MDQSIGYATRVYEAPSANELQRQQRDEQLRQLARRRPADKSPAAVQAALDAVTADKVVADAWLVARQEIAADLLGATPAEIAQARDVLELCQIETDQLDLMAASLRVALARAQEGEAEELAALRARIPAAEAVIAAYRKFIDFDLPRLAGAIKKGLAVEVEAEAAANTLREAAHRLPDVEPPAPLPRVRNGQQFEAFRFRLCVPGHIAPSPSHD